MVNIGVLDNCTDLWYLLSNFFYKHKCCNGYIDPKDPNFHSFKKKDCLYGIRRINDHNFKIKQQNLKNNNEIIIENINSLQELEKKLEGLINGK